MNTRHLKALHELVTGNRALIEAAGAGICSRCGGGFLPDDAGGLLDDSKMLNEPDGFTVVCPHCGCDAVLPVITPALVRAISNHWHN